VPPAPVSAVNESASRVNVLFDRDLAPGLLDAGNWTLDVGPASTATAVLPRTVRLTHAAGAAAGWVTYSPPPFDVVSSEGAAAAGFSEFGVE